MDKDVQQALSRLELRVVELEKLQQGYEKRIKQLNQAITSLKLNENKREQKNSLLR